MSNTRQKNKCQTNPPQILEMLAKIAPALVSHVFRPRWCSVAQVLLVRKSVNNFEKYLNLNKRTMSYTTVEKGEPDSTNNAVYFSKSHMTFG